jgi:hypothetical protein
VNATAWSRGLEVSGDGTGVVSHAGLGLIRHLADKTGLTRGLSAALASGRLLKHDRGRVLADVGCVIADGARSFSDFRVLADQGELSGQVASVPTVCRTLEEIARGGEKIARKLTGTVSTARRFAWSQAVLRHGKLPRGEDRGQDPGRGDVRPAGRAGGLRPLRQGARGGEFQGVRPSPAAGVLR